MKAHSDKEAHMCAHDHTRATNHDTAGHYHDDCCDTQCGNIAGERNRYYTGKYMTARDFRDEQSYFLSRHRLHNRLMHGWGIVCGLAVERHKSAECPNYVVVTPGIAIDCCGRELVLRERTAVPVWPPPEKPAGQGGAAATDTPPEPQQYLVYLSYEEQQIERAPALYADNCAPKRWEANRVREVSRVNVIPWDEAHSSDPELAGCWQLPDVNLKPCSKGCDAEDEKAEGCLDPACPCSLGVPLALITRTWQDGSYSIGEIATDERKKLPPPKEYLTRIVTINWPHGGSVSLNHLRTTMEGRLIVEFDRKLAAPYRKNTEPPTVGAPYELKDYQGDEAIGINPGTFVVQYSSTQEDIEFLDAKEGSPLLEDDCKAVFAIADSKLNPTDRKGNVAGNIIYVTLKCDFILDCNGNSVDGNFLGAKFPTGDGIAGGTFESWFRVTYE
jgi:hypothetical protein